MEKACKGKPKSATIKPTPRADLDDSTEETDKVGGMGKPDDQTGHANSRREMHPPQENTPEMQNDEKQCNIGPTMSGNSTITNRDEIPRNTITYGNSATTSANASSSSGYPRQGAELHSKPTIGDQTNTNYDVIKTYLQKRLFEAITPPKAITTHELSATELYLAERIGIGDITTLQPGNERVTLSGILSDINKKENHCNLPRSRHTVSPGKLYV